MSDRSDTGSPKALSDSAATPAGSGGRAARRRGGDEAVLELQIHPADIRKKVLYLFLDRRQLIWIATGVGAWLLLVIAGLVLLPWAAGDFLQRHERQDLVASIERERERGEELVARLETVRAASADLRVTADKIFLLYGLASDRSGGSGGYPFAGAESLEVAGLETDPDGDALDGDALDGDALDGDALDEDVPDAPADAVDGELVSEDGPAGDDTLLRRLAGGPRLEAAGEPASGQNDGARDGGARRDRAGDDGDGEGDPLIGRGLALVAAAGEELGVTGTILDEIRAFEEARQDVVRLTPSRSPLRRADFVLTSPFGNRRNPFTKSYDFHAGIDMAAPVGTPIYAPADGEVVFAGRYSLQRSVGWWRYGNLVVVRHGEDFVSLYGHCDEVSVRRGQRVSQGDILATVGNTGMSTSPHLHYEIRRRDDEGELRPVDPRIYILDHRWRDEERLLVRSRSAPPASEYQPLPPLARR